MYKFLVALALLSGVSAFAPNQFARSALRSGAPRRATRASLEMKALLLYSTTTGNTETCAGYIADITGLEAQDIGDVSDDDIAGADSLICGTPTWHTGADEQRSGTEWDVFLYDRLPGIDLSGKKVAIFGLGDQAGYADNFCDAMGEFHELMSAKGAEIVGATATDGYDHADSKSIIDGKFVGMPFDEDNQYDMSEGRAKAWIEQCKGEGLSV